MNSDPVKTDVMKIHQLTKKEVSQRENPNIEELFYPEEMQMLEMKIYDELFVFYSKCTIIASVYKILKIERIQLCIL